MIHPQAIDIRSVRLLMSASESAWQHLSNFRFHQRKASGYFPVILDMLLLRDSIEDVLTDIVRDMRNDGISWNEVGDAFGISRQAARQRFKARGIQ